MAMPRNNTIDLLQSRTATSDRAQERIDKDPEEALEALQKHATQQLTLQDVFGLFMQMQQQQAAMQQQIVDLLSRQGQVEQAKRSQRDSREEVAQMQEQQNKTLQAWKDEPRLPIQLEPTPDERKILAVVGEYPPRMHRVNGLEYPIQVGTVVYVPESIHAQITWQQTYTAPHRKPAQSLQAIADPDRGQFLHGSQSVSAGQAGVVGSGPLLVPGLPHSPELAGPLDQRYDHQGR